MECGKPRIVYDSRVAIGVIRFFVFTTIIMGIKIMRKLSISLLLLSFFVLFGCKISGTVTDGTQGVGGVTITMSGAASGTTTTNANGVYTFDNLLSLGNHIITPSHEDYTFEPVSKSLNITFTNMEIGGIVFEATEKGECTDTWIEKLMGRFDINQDGQIAPDEVQSQRVAEFNQMDVDSDGMVSVAEFTANVPLFDFDEFDTNEDGIITVEELMNN